VLEAMAAGCAIVSSALGALPETTAGFARLVSLKGGKAAYLERFVEATVAALTEWAEADAGVESQRRRQVAHVHEHHTWST
jgi:glycosyltransferase involved in cell wall biosynthesis